MDDDPAALADEARTLLAVKGPLAFGELAAELGAWRAGLRKVLDAHPQLLESPDGKWVSGLRLADGVVLTHELSEAEASSGMLSADDDLVLWAVFAAAPGGLPLAGGGVAGTTTFLDLPPGEGEDLIPGQGFVAQYMTGPDGWLAGFAAGDLLAARLCDGTLELSASRPVPPGRAAARVTEACTAAAAEALERYGRGATATPFGTLHEVLIRLLFAEREAFASPQPPLARSLREAGLETFAGSVGVRGTSWNLSRLSRLSRTEAVAGTKATGLLVDPAPLTDQQARQALEYLMSSPAALGFVGGEVERRTAQGTDLGDQLARIADVAESAPERSAACFLKAREAEGGGDSVAAETLVSHVLAGQPRLPGALTDAAEYAACRGDVRAADGYLRQVDHPVSVALRAALGRLLVPPKTAIARNAPCPCGSGRKYKMCCSGKEAHPIADRAEALYALLVTHAQRPAYTETLGVLIARSGATEQAALFCIDLLVTDCGVTDRFLRLRGGWLRDDERELIESWRQIPIEALEIRDVQRGTGVTVRVLPGGKPFFLKDRMFSSSVRRLDLFIGRILHDGTRPRLLALPVQVDRDQRIELLDLLERRPSAQELAEFVAPRPEPCVQNADGHDYYDAEAVWEVPDETAARAGGRARDGLEMLLDDIQWRESREAEAGEPPLMDLAWVRRELGL